MSNIGIKHIVIGICILIGVSILFYIVSKKQAHTENMSNLVEEKTNISDVNDLIDDLKNKENQGHPITSVDEEISPSTLNKLNWKNSAPSEYVKSTYADGERGNLNTGDWDDFYKMNTELIDQSYIKNNDSFSGVDETGGNSASYSGEGHAKMSPNDLFKIDKLLPQETHSDWFEVMPEPIKVKNRHLINVTKPVGINTIGSSLKNASHDLRGNVPCPKFVASPWNQSSIEPDLNIKSFC